MASLAKPGLDKLEAFDPPRYGLLSAVRFRENPPLGWESAGVQAELTIKGPVKAWAVDPATCTWDTANPKSDKTVTVQDNGADVLPITLSATHECTPTGVSFGESEALALELLNRHAEPTLEKAYKNLWVDSHGFWTLELPPATPELSVQTVTKEQVEFIIQALEIQSILQNGSCTLHIPAILYSKARRILTDKGGILRTAKGSPVILGVGYGPEIRNGAKGHIFATPGTLWGYKTQPIVLPSKETFEHGKNMLHTTAHQTYAIGYNPGVVYAHPIAI